MFVRLASCLCVLQTCQSFNPSSVIHSWCLICAGPMLHVCLPSCMQKATAHPAYHAFIHAALACMLSGLMSQFFLLHAVALSHLIELFPLKNDMFLWSYFNNKHGMIFLDRTYKQRKMPRNRSWLACRKWLTLHSAKWVLEVKAVLPFSQLQSFHPSLFPV